MNQMQNITDELKVDGFQFTNENYKKKQSEKEKQIQQKKEDADFRKRTILFVLGTLFIISMTGLIEGLL